MCAAADCAAVLTVVSKDSEAEEFWQFKLWAAQLTPPPKTLARPSPPPVMVLKADLHDYLARPLLRLNESQNCMQLAAGVIICSPAM